MARKHVPLDEDQADLLADLKRAVARDIDAAYLTDAGAVEAAALAYLGRDGWDEVGRDDARGQPAAVADLLDS